MTDLKVEWMKRNVASVVRADPMKERGKVVFTEVDKSSVVMLLICE